MTEREARAAMAWRNVVLALVLNIVGMPVELAVASSVPSLPRWPAFASMAIAAVMLAVLLARRRHPSVVVGDVVFLLDVAVILAALWLIGEAHARSGQPWVPFQEHKLGMVTVAMIAPEAWVGAVGIIAYAAASLAQYSGFDQVARDQLVMTEPWATIAFLVFSGILIVYRSRQMAIEREVAVARTRIEATAHLARVLLAVRDLANTPLQTIAFAAEAARRAHPDVAPLMDSVDRSLGKLRELDRRLRDHDDRLSWSRADESLDAEALVTGAARVPGERR